MTKPVIIPQKEEYLLEDLTGQSKTYLKSLFFENKISTVFFSKKYSMVEGWNL